MLWFPDFARAVELVRRQTRAAGQALETVWPGEVVIYDPRAGEVRGHKQLRRFVRQSQARLAERHVRIETVAATCVSGRAVVDLLAHLADDGRNLAWPVAVVAESPTIGRSCFAPTGADGRSMDGATSGLRYSGPGHPPRWCCRPLPRRAGRR